MTLRFDRTLSPPTTTYAYSSAKPTVRVRSPSKERQVYSLYRFYWEEKDQSYPLIVRLALSLRGIEEILFSMPTPCCSRESRSRESWFEEDDLMCVGCRSHTARPHFPTQVAVSNAGPMAMGSVEESLEQWYGLTNLDPLSKTLVLQSMLSTVEATLDQAFASRARREKIMGSLDKKFTKFERAGKKLTLQQYFEECIGRELEAKHA